MSNEEKKDINEQAPAAAKAPEAAPQAPAAAAKAPEAAPQAPAAAKAAPRNAGNRQQRGGRGRKPSFRKKREQKDDDGLIERVVSIKRVSKVVKGGKNFSFSAVVVAGDAKGQVGTGLGKSNEVVDSIKKGSGNAKKSFVTVTLDGDTIPHEVIGKYKASRVLLKPAGPGTGVIAGGTVRALCDAVGIKNILTKTLGSRNSVNVVKATIDGFKQLRLKRRG